MGNLSLSFIFMGFQRGILGEGAPLSRSSILRLKAKWEKEYREWKGKDLSNLEVVYLWADGLFVKAGIGKDKAALFVVIGALADGNLGICSGVKEQRCWNHKIVNVSDKFPRGVQAEAREYLCKISYASSRRECEELRDKFKRVFESRYPKAFERDWERMVTFYEFPKEHWRHIRTTNVVEFPFSAVRLRTDVGRRFRNVRNAECLIWKVLMVAEKRFRKINASELLVDVYNGVKYVDGKRDERKVCEGVAA